ncbi:MAG: hydrogenase maturation protease [Lysobacterales bacterium]
MNGRQAPAPVLILTYGNPSRGDDALGPAMFDRLEKHKRETSDLDDVDLLTDFQLQIEHAVDLENRQCVLFIDAGMSCAEPFELQLLQAERDDSFTTHAMSPAAVLSVFEQVNQQPAPPAYLLTIRAYEFGLGVPMSTAALENLQLSYQYVVDGQWLRI